MTLPEVAYATKTFGEAFKAAQQGVQLSGPGPSANGHVRAEGPAPPPNRPAQTVQQPAPQPQTQKSYRHRGEQAPPAPTSDKAPYSFAQPARPDGVPTYDRPNDLTADKLVLPDSKRRKLNQANAPAPSSKPPAATPTPTPAPAARPVPQPKQPERPFKCPVAGCEYAKVGFSSGEERAKHELTHREKEPKDPLGFVLEQMRHALGLNEDGKLPPKAKATAMEKSASSQSMKPTLSNQGGLTPGPGGTPMSRAATSQRSHLSHDGARAGTLAAPGAAGSAAGTDASPTLSAWSDAPVSPAELAALFPTPADVLGADSATTLTPASTLSSGKSDKAATPSPGAGGGSGGGGGGDDFFKIDADGPMDDWVPAALLGADEREMGLGDSFFADDDVLGMDWETAFGKTKEETVVKGRKRVPKYDADHPKFDESLFWFTSEG